MATRNNVLARWVTPGGVPQRRLVFFPHAGAGGLSGRSLAADDVEVLLPLHETPYDPCTFSIRDVDGNLWSMGAYRGD